MTQGRPHLKAELKRAVRRRCGFGCVICGFPIYEYDHVLGWANVRRHVAEEITLLCDQHHRAKTAGFLPNERVISANRAPFNLTAGVTRPYDLFYYGNEFTFDIGSVIYQGAAGGTRTEAHAIRIDGQSLLWVVLEDGHYLLNLHLYDPSGAPVLQISDNELVLNARSWDIELVGTRLIIREAMHKIFFDIRFRPPSKIEINTARFLYNGVELLVTRQWCAILNTCMVLANLGMRNLRAGIVIGDDPDHPRPAAFAFDGYIPRDGWDREEAITKVKAITGSKATVLDDLVEG